MSRFLMGVVLLTAACSSHKSAESLCQNQIPAPAACMTACDPSSGTGDAVCPSGFHCASSGKCDAQCTPTGGQCGSGNSCSNDGFCQQDPGDDAPPIDASCPAVHFTATKTTPTVQLLLDQSGSMTADYGDGLTRWTALNKALLDDTTGVVPKLGDKVIFGASVYSNKSHKDNTGKQVGDSPCPKVHSTDDRKVNNLSEIQTLLTTYGPDEDTPTAESIDAIRADFAAHPPMQGSPPIIVLATDGLPDTCADADPPAGPRQEAANQKSVMAAQAAYAAGIKLFFLFVGDDEAGNHPQQMANAGAGMNPLTGNATFYTAKNPAELTAAFNTIIGGVLSCDLKLSGQVDPNSASTGTVALNGNALTYGTDWTIDADGVTLHLLGAACNTLKTSNNPTVDATFNCGSVIF